MRKNTVGLVTSVILLILFSGVLGAWINQYWELDNLGGAIRFLQGALFLSIYLGIRSFFSKNK